MCKWTKFEQCGWTWCYSSLTLSLYGTYFYWFLVRTFTNQCFPIYHKQVNFIMVALQYNPTPLNKYLYTCGCQQHCWDCPYMVYRFDICRFEVSFSQQGAFRCLKTNMCKEKTDMEACLSPHCPFSVPHCLLRHPHQANSFLPLFCDHSSPPPTPQGPFPSVCNPSRNT